MSPTSIVWLSLPANPSHLLTASLSLIATRRKGIVTFGYRVRGEELQAVTGPETHLTLVFGDGIDTSSPEAAARSSTRRFVRGRTQLAIFDPDRQPKGHIISAWEAYQSYGLDLLDEAIEYGTAILARSAGAAAQAIRRQRLALGLEFADVARRTNTSMESLEQLEFHDSYQLDVNSVERVGFVLGLDEGQLSSTPNAGAGARVAARLKTMLAEPRVG
jgi:hypothetical protein